MHTRFSVAVGFAALVVMPFASLASQPTRLMADGKGWTATNVNVESAGSFCYDDDEVHCRRYGRLYTW